MPVKSAFLHNSGHKMRRIQVYQRRAGRSDARTKTAKEVIRVRNFIKEPPYTPLSAGGPQRKHRGHLNLYVASFGSIHGRLRDIKISFLTDYIDRIDGILKISIGFLLVILTFTALFLGRTVSWGYANNRRSPSRRSRERFSRMLGFPSVRF